MKELPDLYRILQVDPSAEADVIYAVYRRLARKYHPDVNPSADANRQMQEINMAYEVLGNPERRLEYDRRNRLSGTRYHDASRRRARPARTGRARARWAGEEAAARPRLVASPEMLELGSMPRGCQQQASFKVEMTHGRKIRGQVLSNQSWIRITSRKDLHDLSEAIVELIVDTSHLRDGVRHYGSVSIESLAYGGLTVPVSVYVQEEAKPQLRVEPKFVQFDRVKEGPPTIVDTIRLWDEAGLPMSGSLHVKPSWLKTDVVDFEGVSELRVGLTADVANLRPGQTYSGRIEVHASNGRGTIVVKATVLPQAWPLPDLLGEDEWTEFLSRLEATTEWERNFLQVVTLQARQKGWRPTHTQRAMLEGMWRRLMEKSC